jgi:hypothetical protein
MNVSTYHALVVAGVLDKVELIEGRVVMGSYKLHFSPEQVRAAASLGIELRSCVDEVLHDPELTAEFLRRYDAQERATHVGP